MARRKKPAEKAAELKDPGLSREEKKVLLEKVGKSINSEIGSGNITVNRITASESGDVLFLEGRVKGMTHPIEVLSDRKGRVREWCWMYDQERLVEEMNDIGIKL